MAQPVFLAAGFNGLRMISHDGRKWQAPTFGADAEVCRGAAVGNGRLVTVGTNGGKQILASSTTGEKWQQSNREGGYGGYLRSLMFVQERFMALGGDPGSVGSAKPYVMFSSDGEKWDEPVDMGGKFMIRRVAFGNNRYVGVGDRGRRATSTDGKTWQDVEKIKAIETLIDIAFGNGQFVGVGLHSLRMSTADGLVWSEQQKGEEGEHLNSIVWADDRFVAVGAGATCISPDGLKWERHANTNAPVTMAYGNGMFVGAKWKGRILVSPDGIRWEEVLQAPQHVEALAFGVL